MRFGQFILIVAFVITPYFGFSLGNISENEKKYFCNFLDSMNYPAFSFTHSEFVGIVELAKQINHSALSLKFNHFSTRVREGNAEIFGFEKEFKNAAGSIRKGKYNLTLYVRKDSLIDFYFQYPPDTNSSKVDIPILEIYLNLIKYGNIFYQLKQYGLDAFKTGMQMPGNYREMLNEFYVSEPGPYSVRKVDRFVFYQSDEYNGQYWIELFVDKKSKKIKSFSALKYE